MSKPSYYPSLFDQLRVPDLLDVSRARFGIDHIRAAINQIWMPIKHRVDDLHHGSLSKYGGYRRVVVNPNDGSLPFFDVAEFLIRARS